MTSLAASPGAVPAPRAPSWTRVALIAVALGAVVAARWATWRGGALDPISVGVLFGAALVALGAAAGWRPVPWASLRSAAAALSLGAAGGAVIAATGMIGQHPVGWAELAAGFPLAPWAAATVLVAAAEEAVLRGALFDAIGGRGLALAATSLLFALMHVPVYGWQGVPLDLGVGLVLGGLRLVSGGVAAPALAHAIADLAVLWL